MSSVTSTVTRSLATVLLSTGAFFSFQQSAMAAKYDCHLNGHIHGESIAIFIGGEYLSGEGVLKCRDAGGGRVVDYPVQFSLAGAGVGFDFSVIRSIRLDSAEIAVDEPTTLYGTYGLGVTTGATLIRTGVAFDTAVMVSEEHGPTFEIGLAGENAVGLGVKLYGMTFKITAR